MNCCGDEVTQTTITEILGRFLENLERMGSMIEEYSTSDLVLCVLFTIHVIIVVSFLFSHCRSGKR